MFPSMMNIKKCFFKMMMMLIFSGGEHCRGSIGWIKLQCYRKKLPRHSREIWGLMFLDYLIDFVIGIFTFAWNRGCSSWQRHILAYGPGCVAKCHYGLYTVTYVPFFKLDIAKWDEIMVEDRLTKILTDTPGCVGECEPRTNLRCFLRYLRQTAVFFQC